MSITLETPIGQIASEYPLTTRVFARHHIDFCCGGARPVGEVCRQQGLDPDVILEEIRHQQNISHGGAQRWNEAPLNDLVQHILSVYHRPLDEELDRLEAMARKVLDVHGSKEPVMLPELLRVYLGLKEELVPHMRKEEQILFPMILEGQGAMAIGPISVIRNDHESAGAALKRLRELTNNYHVREDACNTWRALWHGLEALEEELNQHIHLENNILFPRALAS